MRGDQGQAEAVEEQSAEELRGLYELMWLIRRFEERTTELFIDRKVWGSAHSCIGQEAIAVGAAAALTPEDFIVGHHRSHGHVIARNADVERMMAELLGKSEGYCKGLGGSMHIADLGLGILGCNGVVGAGPPLGCGSALSAQLRGTDQVTVAFFGDGAANEGIVSEAMNMAAAWSLPLIFLCENNQFALSVQWRSTRATEHLVDRAAGFGLPAELVDGNDVIGVREAVGRAVERARRGDGPSFIEAETYRQMQHSMRANLPDERDEDERDAWHERDPIRAAERRLLDTGMAEDQLAAIRDGISDDLEAAIARAERFPVLDVAELDKLVYAPSRTFDDVVHVPRAASGRKLGFTAAVAEAIALEMEVDDSVIVMGEDVGVLGGIFRSTVGLYERFGAERVRDTPISEAGFVGAAVGAALTGMRPIVEIQIFDFVTFAMDALVNQAAKFRFMTGGQASVPLVVRGPAGGGVRLAAQHSQSLEAWFAHVPGLKVVQPADPADAKGLLAAAIREDNPVVCLEAKSLFGGEAEVPEERYALPLGKAAVKHAGSDVTLVAIGSMVPHALRAARTLEQAGTSVEVIDPRTIFPLDLETIRASVSKTNRLVVAHEAVRFGGIGGEIAASIAEDGFWDLDAPIVRVGAPHRPVPYERDLESATLPAARDIVAAIRSLG